LLRVPGQRAAELTTGLGGLQDLVKKARFRNSHSTRSGEEIVKKQVFASVLAGLAMGSAMAAPLMGSTLNYTYYYPAWGTPYGGSPDANGNFVVGPGDEIYSITDAMGFMNVTANQIIVEFSNSSTIAPAPFSGWVLTDIMGTIDRFAAVTIDAATTLLGLDASRLSYTDDTIALNWQGLSFDAGTRVVLNVLTDNGPATPIPEPGSLPLLGAALLGIAFIRHRG
jgi:hypothetical protein